MFTLNCNGRLLAAQHPLVMGIINCTPDSFYDGSRFNDRDVILKQAEKMLHDGADIIDIGGQSTRPGAEQVSITEELNRVVPAIDSVRTYFPDSFISIDTYYTRVAREAVAMGASIVNDISAGNTDQDMIPSVASMNIPYVCMHMKWNPQTMQKTPLYENLHKELLDFFIAKKKQCRDAGIKDIIIDPGFGFGKSIQHNFQLLNHLEIFKMIDCPILVGLSRKSSIYKTLEITVQEALNGTTVLNTIALMKGASILRVHDVKEAKEAVRLVRMMVE